jgi:uncharacterized protein (TIGR00255 family)
MTYSMTAFAREQKQLPWGRAVWEIRSVNHRFLEITLRLPEELRSLDPTVREHLSAKISRGKIDCSLRFEPEKGTDVQFNVNISLAEQLLNAARQLQTLDSRLSGLNVAEVLRWPGVLEAPTPDLDVLGNALLTELDHTLEHFIAHRQREGSTIRALLLERCDAISAEVATVRAALPDILQAQRERLQARVEEVLQHVDQDRLEQEMVLFAQKMDVAEELERLETHVQEVRAVLQQNKPVGRRLDFLMQELNREANTLGSKSVHTSSSAVAINLKVLIEQMREQVQNVE